MLRKVPPLEALEIFVTAARSGSFRSVARDLALSPSAVSRRIAALESFLGVSLFDRAERSQKLNSAGRHYLSQIEPAIEAIRRATATLAREDEGVVKVATSHSLATSWLMPRLADLRRSQGIEAEILPVRDFDVLRSGEAHLGIWGGIGTPADMIADIILDPKLLPVAAQVLADKRPAPRCEAELEGHTLLAVSSPSGIWERWLMAGDAPPRYEPKIREFATLQLMYEAAVAGLGVTLAMPLLAEPFLDSTRLRPCMAAARPVGETYRLYRPRGTTQRSPTERRFLSWLRTEVDASVRRFDEICAIPPIHSQVQPNLP